MNNFFIAIQIHEFSNNFFIFIQIYELSMKFFCVSHLKIFQEYFYNLIFFFLI